MLLAMFTILALRQHNWDKLWASVILNILILMAHTLVESTLVLTVKDIVR
jgi:hypothetical protein